jgi:hypothetical protein
MWNCGDDFIAYGVRNIFDSCLGKQCNYVAYNRNPDLHFQRVRHPSIDMVNANKNNQKSKLDLRNYISKTNWVFDNSWHPRIPLDNFSAVVFAGTPEWFGPMVSPLTEALKESDVPVFYLGVGGFERRENLKLENLSALDQAVLKKAELITVRDKQAESLLKPLNPLHLPCPALLSSKNEFAKDNKPGGRGKIKIALSTQPEKSYQPPSSQNIYEYTLRLFKALIKHYDCEVVCHYIDEIDPLTELGVPVKYSYDARDYFEIYSNYDLLVSTRVHGAGAAASLGIPAFVISHSARSSTVEGFMSELISPADDSVETVLQRIEKFNIQEKAEQIKQHKDSTLKRYEELLKPLLLN